MKYWSNKLAAEVKTHGGKHYTCRRIMSLSPRHYSHYLDACLGGGSMTYNAPAGLARQVACETDLARWAAKVAIRDSCDAVARFLRGLQYNEQTFEAHRNSLIPSEEAWRKTGDIAQLLNVAVHYIVSNRMSRGGMGKTFGWSNRLRGKKQPGGPVPGDLNAWNTMLQRLPQLSNRLQKVELVHGRCEDFLLKLDGDLHEWWTYVDPPYPKMTRSTKAEEYGDDEMSDEQHVELLKLINRLSARGMRFTISSYDNPIYREGLSGWNMTSIEMPNHSSQSETKERRVEALWMNY